MRASDFDLIFVGGGLASGLSALAVRERNPHLRVALIERDGTLGGNHTWCFHAADVPAEARGLVEPLVVRRWDGYTVRFPARTRRLPSPYACVTSARLHDRVQHCFEQAPGSVLLLGTRAVRVDATEVALAGGRTLRAPMVVDARGPERDVLASARGYQKFVGLEMRVEPHPSHPEEPVLFDACVAQRDGFRFMYRLPLARDTLLLEETFFSESPELHEDDGVRAVLAYAEAQGVRVRDVLRIERGVLPMPWAGSSFAADARPLRAGYGGGLFHPVTGYSFPLAVRFALALAACDLQAGHVGPLSELARAQAAQQPFLQLLTRMLFRAFAPDERFRVLEHFYRLPEPLIARFYAAELGVLDRARILVGAPPRGFSIGRALRGSARGVA